MIDTGLRGRVALITGANNPRGIGVATANAFATQGTSVFLAYLRMRPESFGISSEEAQRATEPGLPLYYALQTGSAEPLARVVRAAGGRAEAWEADLADPATVPALFDHAEATLGPVDILVNNAAHCEVSGDTIFSTSARLLDQTFAVNMRAAVLLSAEFIRRCQARGATWGRIINLSTDAAQTFAGQIAYGASKAAMEAFTRSIAIEAGPLGITVNCVAPGPVQSGYITPEDAQRVLPDIPLRRLGEPDDIADAIVFLCSDAARYLHGQTLEINGGMLAP